MLHKIIPLREENGDVTLEVFCTRMGDTDTPPRPAFIVCPGGAYEMCCSREGEPIALSLISKGFQSFVLNYSVGEHAVYPAPLVDVSMAVCHVKENSREYNVDPDKIFVLGFSAGGHLAAAYGVFWNTDMAKFDGMESGANKPAGAVPCYPVITPDDKTGHFKSYSNICGGDDKVPLLAAGYDPSENVSSDTVPMFLWHTFSDGCVPVDSSLIMANALKCAGIPFELHIYPNGGHGLSLANAETAFGNEGLISRSVSQWLGSVVIWAEERCKELG